MDNGKDVIYISPLKLLLAVTGVIMLGALVFGLTRPSGTEVSTGYSGPGVAATATGNWSEAACGKYLREVFGFPNLSMKHGIVWYADCEATPVMKYPTAPAPLPAGHFMPTLPYKP